MALQAFLGDAVLSGGKTYEAHAIVAEAGRVRQIVPHREVPGSAQKINCAGLTLAAGLVDAQVNGGGGILLDCKTTSANLKTLADAHTRSGTTSFLPTLISGAKNDILHALQLVREFRQSDGHTSGVIGVHLEGPFLNPGKHGIHPEKNILKPDAAFLDGLDFSNLGAVLMTVAPECFEPDLLARLHKKKVTLAAGHSLADEKTLIRAKQEGLSGVTHLFNAMGSMTAREPGLSGLALEDADLSCSVIADGAHVSASMIRLAYKTKPRGKLFLVSDAMPCAGQQPPQDFDLMGQKIFVRHGRCEDEGGRLAGSAFTLFECLRHTVQQVGLPLAEAHAMASLYPALFLGCEKEVGSLERNSRADIIGFTQGLELKKVWKAGVEVSAGYKQAAHVAQ
jgi:N-acetylglucosamine-6-phosphate deacetylase